MSSRRIGRNARRRGRSIGRPAFAAAAAIRLASVAAAALLGIATLAGSPARAQGLPSTDSLRIGGDQAYNWVEGGSRVLFVDGNVSFTTDQATLSADRAVIWLTPGPGDGTPGAASTEYRVEIALIGNARVQRGDVVREGPELFVTLESRPDVQLNAANLQPANRSDDVHYLAASQMRRRAQASPPTPLPPGTSPDRTPTPPASRPTTTPSTRPAGPPGPPLTFSAARVSTEMTPEGRVALILSGDEQSNDVLLSQARPDGSRIQLQANHVVIFSNLTDARQLMQGRLGELNVERDVDAAYLEGDVRINVTPASPVEPEQSLRASRVVYEFGTDRAILTDVLMHSYDPNSPAPLTVRAQAMRQLGKDTFEADRASITTSNFNTPAISLAASKVTVRQGDTGDPRLGTRTSFLAENVTPRLYGTPVFWLPRVWGSTTEGGGVPLRDIQLSQTSGFGFGLETKWGLFETIGQRPPEGADAAYRLDYYTDRGPAFGLDTHYAGGSINDTTLQPWSFLGDFTGYAVYDDGQDRLGKRRARIPHDGEWRGRIRWDHQQFLTDNWQVQARLGYVSDGTFLEEWFRNEFRNGKPHETSLYVKRSVGSEFFSVLGSLDTSNVPTVADQLQEVRIDNDGNRNTLYVERLPEITYQRLGDSLADDRLTFVSRNSLAGLHFSESYDGLSDLGFRRRGSAEIDEAFAGIPSFGYTGYTDDYVIRGDFRQEVAMPLGDDRVRVTPYGVLRYTAYSDSPGGSARDRLLLGTGVRTSTQFFKVYDNVYSKLLDINRLRHIIEPQVNLFGAVQTQDREDLWIYDEEVDGVSDLAAAQFAVRQRFQTKRGGPGRERSVDFLTFNTGVNLFANEPDEPQVPYGVQGDNTFVSAESFRGLYFNALPEASVPRSTVFADSVWRVTDTTAILSDTSWNIDDGSLATVGAGVAVQREPRVRYFVGARYIGEINSTIGSFSVDYELTQRYSIAFNESFNLTEGASQNTSLEVVRKFEQFVFTLTVYFDQIEDEGGIAFSISPRNIPLGFRVNNGAGGRR